jgi:hypothetical protein
VAGHRVLPALVAGRTTPGLRTVTVVAAAGSGIRVGRALSALVLGSSLFLQAHLLLGYALGPAVRELLERARVPVLVVAAVALAAAATLLLRRGRRGRATRVLAEGACPACLALGLLGPAGRPARPATAPTPPAPNGPDRAAGHEGAPGQPAAGRSPSGGRRYTSRLASLGVVERSCPDLLGQSRPSCLGDCWTCSTAGEPPFESGDLPELLNALVANSTTASPASTVATRMARQGRHPVRAAVVGSSGKRASFSRRP